MEGPAAELPCGPEGNGDRGRLLPFPPRTIPFRSASFSQVDVTSEGKYVQRNPCSSPITLKPTAFCLNTPIEESSVGSEGTTSIGIPPAISHIQSRSCPVELTELIRERLTDGLMTPETEGAMSPETDWLVGNPPSLYVCHGQEQEATVSLEQAHPLNFILGGDDEPQQEGPGRQDNKNRDRGHLLRQSSAQSDSASDEPPLVTSFSDGSCPSPPQPRSGRGSQSKSSTLRLGSSAEAEDSSSDSGKPPSSPSNVTTQELPYPRGSSKDEKRKDPSKDEKKKDIVMRNMGFYKRPLRGPYGEMLEAEMKKLLPRREEATGGVGHSKSSSPTPPTGRVPEEASHETTSSPFLLGSLDDLNLKVTPAHKHHLPNPRSRKTINNIISLQTSKEKEAWSGGIGLHQRTASTPSDIRYTTTTTGVPTSSSSSSQHPTAHRQLEGTPRGHVLAEILETERSYVDALRTLVKNYMEPLKASDFMEEDLVDDIFFQVPRILWHHERLLDAFQKRLVDDNQCIGDVVLDAFRQTSLQECYSLFVRNWKSAKGLLKVSLGSKPNLGRFMERAQSEHKGKLSLDALFIMPIQRIPRYELLFKELLKHTQAIHEDHSRLILLLDKLRKFALHVDCASVDPGSRREVEIDGWPSGLAQLVRQEILPVALNSPSSRKERAVFLLPDTLLVASIKRKGNRKNQSNSISSGCKFKLMFKVNLGNVGLPSDDVDSLGKARGPLEGDDFRTLQRISDLASSLKCNHVGLDTVLSEMLLASKNSVGEASLELQLKGTEGSEGPDWMKLFFGSAESRNAWLQTFSDTMDKYMRCGIGKSAEVEFYQAVPIRKTRAGLLLSCAAPVSLQGKLRHTDVWVANSDGYVGQICILNLCPEPPSITSCNGVCNSRITCMAPVPPADDWTKHPKHACSVPPESSHPEEMLKLIAGESEGWSIWLGTEDGGLHIYDCADSVRVKKNRHRVQHKAPLNTITFFQDRVFLSLGNGDVVVYSRSASRTGWATGEPSWVTIGTPMAPVTNMLSVGQNLWCASGPAIKIYTNNLGMLELVECLHMPTEKDETPKTVTALVTTGDWVWVAVQGSTVLIAYDAETFQIVHQVNVASHVTKILAGCDDIIRQHKSACLRVTALFVSPGQTLWIGTSGGVILTLCPANSCEAKVTALPQGHTGQVRFLTACLNRDTWTVISGGDGHEEFRQLASSPISTYPTSFAAMVTSLMGDSGGDTSGREDSTNHLLVWKIHNHARLKE